MDLKTPSTEMEDSMRVANFYTLGPVDIVKVVVETERDLDWAVDFLRQPALEWLKCRFSASPRWGKLEPRKLVEWMEKRKLFDWTLNLQLHKYIWPETIKTDGLTKEELIQLER